MDIKELAVSSQESLFDKEFVKKYYEVGDDAFFDMYYFFFLPPTVDYKNFGTYFSKLKLYLRYV